MTAVVTRRSGAELDALCDKIYEKQVAELQAKVRASEFV